MNKMKKIRGIVTAILTPLDANGELKEDSLRKLVDFQIQNKVHGLFPLGTVGEGVYLQTRVRKKAAEIIVDQVKSRIPIILHIGAAEIETTLELARHAKDIGVDAISSVCPFYYRPDIDSLIGYFKQIAKSSGLPIFIYNNTGRQGYNLDPKTFGKIASEVPEIVGIKDTSYNVEQIASYVQEYGNKYNIIGAGDSMMLANFVLGTDAHICAISNIFPKLAVKLYETITQGDIAKAREIQFKINSIRSLLKEVEIAPYKVALRLHNIDAGYPARPLRNLSDEESKILLNKLKNFLEVDD